MNGRKNRREAAFDSLTWNVRNRKTGQVFKDIPGRTPMDAKKRLISTDRSNDLRGVTPLDLEADPSDNTHPSQLSTDVFPVARNIDRTPRDWPSDRGGDRFSRYSPNEPYEFPSADSGSDSDVPPIRPAPQPKIGVGTPTGATAQFRRRRESSGAGSMGANAPVGRDEQREAFKRAVREMVREVVRKKAGGGGYQLYAPNKGKKKSPKPVGEFPTRVAAKNAELARFPPKDPEQLKKMRSRLDKLKKDPKKRSAAERQDISGRKHAKKSGAPAHDRKKRKESLVRAMSQDLHERLFHEDEVPGSPWDERISSLHPDAVSSDRKLHALHRGIEKASIGALGDAHRGLTKALRGLVKIHPGDIAVDGDRKKTFMPVMLDCDGFEVGPVHLYIDGGHVKIEVSREAREAIAQLEPDMARDLRGGLMSFEEDHLSKIDGAQKAWQARDTYLDKLHGRLEKHASGLSGVEHHLLKGLLAKGGKRK